MHGTTLRRFAISASLAAGSTLSAQARPQPEHHGSSPVVSPDGRRIAFLSTRDGTESYYIVNDDGSGLTRVAAKVAGNGRPTWSADGSQLFVSAIRADTIRVSAIPAAGGGPREIGLLRAQGAKATTVGGDAKRVVYGAGDWTTMQLFAASLAGGEAKQITSGRAAFWCQTISTDGKQIAVGRIDSTRQMQVWVMNVDGTGARALTHFTRAEGNPNCPVWSADGRRIAVQAEVPSLADSTKGIGSIWVIDAASGAATKLASHTTPYLDELPTWFPDGKRIAFQSDRTGRWEIWVMNADGSGVRQLTK